MCISVYSFLNLNIIILVLIYPPVTNSTSCSIFLSLNCSCFQSNSDVNISSPIKIYSHLYCQGNSLNEKTFKSPFGFDFENQTYFRTISLDFSLRNQVEIHLSQFDSLSKLFSQTNSKAIIELSIRFNGFTHITFKKHSLTSNMFQKKHNEKHLSLHFIPITTNDDQIDSDIDSLTDVNDQFKFLENCFYGLTVSHLNIYSYTKNGLYSSSFPFEYVFNNTNIGELHFHGSIIPPGPYSLRRTFKGRVRSLTLHRHIDIIDSSSFPNYFSVYSYNIHSIEAYSMNLDSFIPVYTNLRGIELTKPHFEVSINKFIPTLDSLTLDIECLNEQTILAARHINHLKLGPRLRRIHPQALHSLERHLKHFDLSEINLTDMRADSRCYLMHFIHQHYKYQLNIVFPRLNNFTECDCNRLILIDIQLNRKLDKYPNDDLLCTKKCRFSDCSVISEYFREKFPVFTNENELKNMMNDTNHDLPSFDLFSDSMDVDMMHFLFNQTIDQQKPIDRRISTKTPFTNVQYFDNVLLSTENIDSDLFNVDKNNPLKSKRDNFFSWTSFLLLDVIILIMIIFILIIIYFFIKHRERQHMKNAHVYV